MPKIECMARGSVGAMQARDRGQAAPSPTRRPQTRRQMQLHATTSLRDAPCYTFELARRITREVASLCGGLIALWSCGAGECRNREARS